MPTLNHFITEPLPDLATVTRPVFWRHAFLRDVALYQQSKKMLRTTKSTAACHVLIIAKMQLRSAVRDDLDALGGLMGEW